MRKKNAEMSCQSTRQSLVSSQLQDATLTTTNTMTATTTSTKAALRIGDSVRLSTPWSDGSIVSYWAKCYRIADDGRAAIRIPANVMSLQFPPFTKDRMLITNEILEASIKRA